MVCNAQKSVICVSPLTLHLSFPMCGGCHKKNIFYKNYCTKIMQVKRFKRNSLFFLLWLYLALLAYMPRPYLRTKLRIQSFAYKASHTKRSFVRTYVSRVLASRGTAKEADTARNKNKKVWG